jgi:hypothetical protein
MSKRLSQYAVPTSVGKAYTCPANQFADLLDMEIANTTATDIYFTAYIVPSGGSSAASNTLFPTANIPANTLVQWSGIIAMVGADSLRVFASAVGITITVSGTESNIS